jgi:hypothetical protein
LSICIYSCYSTYQITNESFIKQLKDISSNQNEKFENISKDSLWLYNTGLKILYCDIDSVGYRLFVDRSIEVLISDSLDSKIFKLSKVFLNNGYVKGVTYDLSGFNIDSIFIDHIDKLSVRAEKFVTKNEIVRVGKDTINIEEHRRLELLKRSRKDTVYGVGFEFPILDPFHTENYYNKLSVYGLNLNLSPMQIFIAGGALFYMVVGQVGHFISTDYEFEKYGKAKATINGLSILPLVGFSTSFKKLNGVSLSGIYSDYYEINGWALAPFLASKNFKGFGVGISNKFNNLYGMQLGVFNVVGKKKGVQLGLIKNFSINSKGLQLSSFNMSKDISGVQIGLINVAEKTHGFQFGLLNINEKRWMPIINWNFD